MLLFELQKRVDFPNMNCPNYKQTKLSSRINFYIQFSIYYNTEKHVFKYGFTKEQSVA